MMLFLSRSSVRMVDCNNDGVSDSQTEFAAVDNPRGILPLGDRLFVLHTVFEDGFATGMDLVVFEDKDQDGVADGPSKPLIEHLRNPRSLHARGTENPPKGTMRGIDGSYIIV